MKIKKTRSETGFTIIELMIAMSVLATLLVISTVIMMQISNLYTKGVNASNLQNVTRNLNNDLASAVEFSGNQIIPCTQITQTCYATSTHATRNNPESFGSGYQVYAYCVGKTRYSYVLNRIKGTDLDNGAVTPHVMWQDKMLSSADCHPLDITKDIPEDFYSTSAGEGHEIVPENMRVTRFNVVEEPASSGIYKVDVWLAYGDNDLVNTDPSNGSSRCNSVPGSHFCGVSEISTKVIRRVE